MALHNALQQLETDSGDVEISVSIPADLLAALKVAGFQRRSLGEAEASTEHLIREALTDWLEKEIAETNVVSIQLRP